MTCAVESPSPTDRRRKPKWLQLCLSWGLFFFFAPILARAEEMLLLDGKSYDIEKRSKDLVVELPADEGREAMDGVGETVDFRSQGFLKLSQDLRKAVKVVFKSYRGHHPTFACELSYYQDGNWTFQKRFEEPVQKVFFMNGDQVILAYAASIASPGFVRAFDLSGRTILEETGHIAQFRAKDGDSKASFCVRSVPGAMDRPSLDARRKALKEGLVDPGVPLVMEKPSPRDGSDLSFKIWDLHAGTSSSFETKGSAYPLEQGGDLYLVAGDRLMRLSGTSQTLWTLDLGRPIMISDVHLLADGRHMAMFLQDHVLAMVDVGEGKLLWRLDEMPPDPAAPTPAHHKFYIFARAAPDYVQLDLLGDPADPDQGSNYYIGDVNLDGSFRALHTGKVKTKDP